MKANKILLNRIRNNDFVDRSVNRIIKLENGFTTIDYVKANNEIERRIEYNKFFSNAPMAEYIRPL